MHDEHARLSRSGSRRAPSGRLSVLLGVLSFLWTVVPASAAVLERASVSIVYDPAEESIARHSADVLEAALTDLGERLPNSASPIRVVICRTYDEFRKQAGPYAIPGVGGVAVASEGFIAIKSPRIQRPEADYEGILRHELIHLLLARNFNVENMPRWLNEGLTMLLSGERRWDDRALVSYLYLRGNLIDFRNLPFALELGEHEGRMGDAYAQSLSMVEYLMRRVGEERFWALLRSLDTRDFDSALQAETGIAPHVFWDQWRRSLWKVALVFSLVSGFSAFQLMVLLALLAWWRLRRRNRRTLRRWQQEEDEDDDIPYLFAHELEGLDAPYPWEEDEEEGRP